VQPFCEHGEPGHCLVETQRKVQILNEWLAKDVAAVACSSNMNHLSSQPINENHSSVRPKDEIPTGTITGKMLNVYPENGHCTQETSK